MTDPKTQPLQSTIQWLLNGDYISAKRHLQHLSDQHLNREIIDRFHLIIRYEQYERMPGETNTHITEAAVQKEKTGGLPRKQASPLPETGDAELDVVIRFLNHRLQAWEWRCTRNLIRGSRFAPDASRIAIIYQKQLSNCQALMEAGDLGAGIVAADFYWLAGQPREAMDGLIKTNDLAVKSNNLIVQAYCHLCAGDWLSAPYSSPVLWNLAMQASSSQSGVLPAAVESAEFQPPSPEHAEYAKKHWNDAGALFEETGWKEGSAQILLRLDYSAMLQEDFETCGRMAEQAREMFLKNNDHLYARLAETHLLMALMMQNKISEAREMAKSIGQWAKTSGSTSWALGLGILMGRFARHLMLRKGMVETALKAYRITRELFLSADARFHAAQHLTDIAEVYKATGQTDAAIIHFEQAADEIESVIESDWKGVHDELHTALHTLTGIAMLMSDNMNIGMRRADASLIDRSILRMGKICERIQVITEQENPQGMPQLDQVFGLYREMSELGRVFSPLYRAKTLRNHGDFDGFESEWQKALEALPTLAPVQQGMAGATLWGVKRDWEKSSAYFREYIRLGGFGGGFTGDLLEFIERFGEQGKEEAQHHQYHFQSQALTGFVRHKQFQEALKYYESLCRSGGEKWWIREESPWHILSDCGEMMEGLGRLEEALQLFDAGIGQLEARRQQLRQDELKVALADSQNTSFLYAGAARTAMAAGKPDVAFRYAEQGKARGLLDLMNENQYLASSGTEAHQWIVALRELDARHSTLTGQLARERSGIHPNPQMLEVFQTQITELENQRLQIENTLARSGIQPAHQSVKNLQLGDIKSISAALSPETLLVEYLLSGDDLLIWAIGQQGILFAKACKTEDWIIKSEINYLLQMVQSRQPWQSAAERLSARLLAPFAEVLTTFSRVVMVPHGPLHLLPFQLLTVNERPLGLTHAVSFLPSAGAVQFLNAGSDLSRSRVLAIGNPTGDLPAAEVEALFVSSQSTGGSEVLIGHAATVTAIRERLHHAVILHLATHGNLSAEAPMQTVLQLADGGELTLGNLMGMQLKADLVVLSACETARGKETGGDDILGLTRGLLAGGAQSAIVSLWPVNDVSTALLMGHFYQQLRHGKAPAEALRLAQVYLSEMDVAQQNQALQMLENAIGNEPVRSFIAQSRSSRDIKGRPEWQGVVDYRHPYYWAGFVLVGR